MPCYLLRVFVADAPSYGGFEGRSTIILQHVHFFTRVADKRVVQRDATRVVYYQYRRNASVSGRATRCNTVHHLVRVAAATPPATPSRPLELRSRPSRVACCTRCALRCGVGKVDPLVM